MSLKNNRNSEMTTGDLQNRIDILQKKRHNIDYMIKCYESQKKARAVLGLIDKYKTPFDHDHISNYTINE